MSPRPRTEDEYEQLLQEAYALTSIARAQSQELVSELKRLEGLLKKRGFDAVP